MKIDEPFKEVDGRHLTPKEWGVFIYLYEHGRERYCSTEELWTRCWPDTTQSGQVKRVIKQLRGKGLHITNRLSWGWRLIDDWSEEGIENAR